MVDINDTIKTLPGQGLRLDLGGGLAPANGHTNVDIIDDADIVTDLNTGLTDDIKDNSVEGIRCHQVLEHLDDIITIMNDCYAVMREGAQFEISVPYANTKQSLQDPTHKRQFVEESFLYFADKSPYKKEQDEYGITARFKIIRCERGTGTDDWQLFVVLEK